MKIEKRIENYVKGDHLHCCPHGKMCDISAGRCVSQISIPWFTKKDSFPLKRSLFIRFRIDYSLKRFSGRFKQNN